MSYYTKTVKDCRKIALTSFSSPVMMLADDIWSLLVCIDGVEHKIIRGLKSHESEFKNLYQCQRVLFSFGMDFNDVMFTINYNKQVRPIVSAHEVKILMRERKLVNPFFQFHEGRYFVGACCDNSQNAIFFKTQNARYNERMSSIHQAILKLLGFGFNGTDIKERNAQGQLIPYVPKNCNDYTMRSVRATSHKSHALILQKEDGFYNTFLEHDGRLTIILSRNYHHNEITQYQHITQAYKRLKYLGFKDDEIAFRTHNRKAPEAINERDVALLYKLGHVRHCDLCSSEQTYYVQASFYHHEGTSRIIRRNHNDSIEGAVRATFAPEIKMFQRMNIPVHDIICKQDCLTLKEAQALYKTNSLHHVRMTQLKNDSWHITMEINGRTFSILPSYHNETIERHLFKTVKLAIQSLKQIGVPYHKVMLLSEKGDISDLLDDQIKHLYDYGLLDGVFIEKDKRTYNVFALTKQTGYKIRCLSKRLINENRRNFKNKKRAHNFVKSIMSA